MASRSLWRQVILALEGRAASEIGERSAIEYIERWTAHASLQSLADSLCVEMERAPSRRFVSFVAHRLTPDASTRIHAARTARRSGQLQRYPKPRAVSFWSR